MFQADDVDICILEEPEHLNWYREASDSWTDKFKHVVGIIHTNYFAYAQEQPGALVRVSVPYLSPSIVSVIDLKLYSVGPAFIVGAGNATFVFLDVQSTLPSDYQTLGDSR